MIAFCERNVAFGQRGLSVTDNFSSLVKWEGETKSPRSRGCPELTPTQCVLDAGLHTSLSIRHRRSGWMPRFCFFFSPRCSPKDDRSDSHALTHNVQSAGIWRMHAVKNRCYLMQNRTFQTYKKLQREHKTKALATIAKRGTFSRHGKCARI